APGLSVARRLDDRRQIPGCSMARCRDTGSLAAVESGTDRQGERRDLRAGRPAGPRRSDRPRLAALLTPGREGDMARARSEAPAGPPSPQVGADGMKLQPTATWSPKQERVALLIAAGRSIKAAAAEAKCGERTAHAWLEDHRYRSLISELRHRMLDEAVGTLA